MKITVLVIPFHTRAAEPAFTKAAPIIPPISACDELVGRPRYHVMIFHPHAPIRAPNIVILSTVAMSTIPLPIVLATWRPKKRKAIKLKNAAHIMATLGDKTRVDTTVAMELAESWKPFKKSKRSARAIRKSTANVMG